MKKLIIITMMLFVVSGSLSAQSKMTDQEKEEFIARHEANIQELNLTDEQKPKVEGINMTYFKALSSLKKSNGSKLEKYRSFQSSSSTRDEEMKKVLTKEQFKIYKDNHAEQRDQFKERRRNNN